MESEAQLTFEDLVRLDQELKENNLSEDLTAEVAALSLPTIPHLCPLYKKIRPVIATILVIPFIPASVKAAVKTLMSILDALCP